MESVNETWLPVKGFEGLYEVSNLGRIKSLPWERRHWCGRMIPQPERMVTLTKHTGGYRMVALRIGKKHFVHRLVMSAFVGEPNGRDVNHINGDKTDNRLENLEYCDRLHNVRHAIATGLQDNSGEGNGMHKYTSAAVIAAHGMVANGSTYAEASRATGVSSGIIQQVAKGVRWKHLGLPVIQRPMGFNNASRRQPIHAPAPPSLKGDGQSTSGAGALKTPVQGSSRPAVRQAPAGFSSPTYQRRGFFRRR